MFKMQVKNKKYWVLGLSIYSSSKELNIGLFCPWRNSRENILLNVQVFVKATLDEKIVDCWVFFRGQIDTLGCGRSGPAPTQKVCIWRPGKVI